MSDNIPPAIVTTRETRKPNSQNHFPRRLLHRLSTPSPASQSASIRVAAKRRRAMTPSIACPVKCRPHPRLAPQPPAPSLELLAARGAPAAGELRASRSLPYLSLSRSADSFESRAPCRGSASARRARAAVALGGDGQSAALIAGAQSRHAIFSDELVRRAFAAAEAAHRGQVRDRVPVARICIYSVMVCTPSC